MANLLHIALFITAAVSAEAYVLRGFYYGLDADNLPPPSEVVRLCRKYNVSRIRLYEPNIDILEAFRGMGIEVSFGLSNSDLMDMSADSSVVERWFNTYVKPFIGDFVINYIIVGDKAIPGLDDVILPVMKSLQNILNANYLGQVKVTTLMGYNSALAVKDPPSSGTFQAIAAGNIKGILQFLSEEGSPLMVALSPYMRYQYDGNISLSYAQFGTEAVRDGPLTYTNLFDAMVDAIYAAMEREGVEDVAIVIGETGWPTCGDEEKTTVALAKAYNQKFLKHISSGEGTPRKPNVYMEGFIQSLFNENQEPEGDSRCYGVFNVNLDPIYDLFTPADH